MVIANAASLGYDYFEAMRLFAMFLAERKRPEEAVELLTGIISRNPGMAEAWVTLGYAHHARDHYASRAAFEKAARLAPFSDTAVMGLAKIHDDEGDAGGALALYDRIIARTPGHAAAHTRRGEMLMSLGRWREGFHEYEWRWKKQAFAATNRIASDQPEWRGEDLSGKTLLVQWEQGLGDVIQFVRYLLLPAFKNTKLIFVSQPRLTRLLQCLAGVTVVTNGDPLPPHDYTTPVMSLPAHLGADAGIIPTSIPYIAAEPGMVDKWSGFTAALTARRVGLVWAGSPTHLYDYRRSIPLETLAALGEVEGITLVSLQQGPHEQDAGVNLLRSGALEDFSDTAGLIANLDLVIAIDTSVAHLAGAMGKPVWLLLSKPAEWRWGQVGEDCPWYSTMRIFRQSRPGDWAELVQHVAEALRQLQQR